MLSLHTEAAPPPESPEGDPGEGDPGEGEPGEGDAGEGAGAGAAPAAGAGVVDGPATAAFGLEVGATNLTVGTGVGVGRGVTVGGDDTGDSVYSSSRESHINPM